MQAMNAPISGDRRPMRKPIVARLSSSKSESKENLDIMITKARSSVEDAKKTFQLTGKRYEDPEFPATPSSIGGDLSMASTFVWLRPREFSGGKSLYLFQDGVEPGDVVQGLLGDCYFLGALMLVSQLDQRIQSLFIDYDQAAGIYVISFMRNSNFQFITIDDRIPCLAAERRPAFASNKPSANGLEYWVPLMEKAYAKLYGNYYNLEAGNIVAALVDLTGGFPDPVDLSWKSDDIWNDIHRRITSGSELLGCSRAEGSKAVDMGIIPGHAYAILHTYEYHGLRMLHIRNPWGKGEWTGKWSDKDAKSWKDAPDMERTLHHTFDDDGTFFMEFRDFIQHFQNIDALRLRPVGWVGQQLEGEWKPNSAGGCANFTATWNTNPNFQIQVTEPTDVSFVLSQPFVRGTDKKLLPMGIYVLKNAIPGKRVLALTQDQLATDEDSVKGPPSFAYTQQVATTFHMIPSESPYAVIPSTFEPNCLSPFTLSVLSSAAVSVSTVTPLSDWKVVSVDSEWTSDTAGGCANNSTSVTHNPQFRCVLPSMIKSSCPVLVKVSLSNSSPSVAPGCYILKNSEKSKVIFKADDVLATASFIKGASTTVISLASTPESSFIILPCTFSPGYIGKFSIMIYSEMSGVDLKPLVAVNVDSIDGEWGADSGGYLYYPRWRTNPMIAIGPLTNDETLTISVSSTSGTSLGMAIFTTDDLSHPYVTLDAAQKSWEQPAFSYKPIDATFNLKSGTKLIVLPTTYEPNTAGKFSLTAVSASGQLFPFYRVPYPSSSSTASMCGVWSKSQKTAGGCMNTESYIENKTYHLKLSQSPCTVRIELMQSEKVESKQLIGCGFYLSKTASTVTKQNLIPGFKPEFGFLSNMSKCIQMPSGLNEIGIMPCSFNKGDEGAYTLKVTVDVGSVSLF